MRKSGAGGRSERLLASGSLKVADAMAPGWRLSLERRSGWGTSFFRQLPGFSRARLTRPGDSGST